MQNSKIEWTDHTFNPWWGCVEARQPDGSMSEECRLCYARTFAKRVGFDIWGAEKERRFFGQKLWNEPLKWNKKARADGRPAKVFCASMGDVCEIHPDKQTNSELDLDRRHLVELIWKTPWLRWLLLTKRPENFNELFGRYWDKDWPSNVWAMTTVGHPDSLWRIDELLKVPAKVRGLSMEPLLGPIDLTTWLPNQDEEQDTTAFHNFHHPEDSIHWVICGGESGPKARPMHPEWARALRDQCQNTRVPFHFKQWGEWWPVSQMPDGEVDRPCRKKSETKVLQLNGGVQFSFGPGAMTFLRVGKKAAGRILDGRTWDEFPEFSPASGLANIAT